jgi:pilus assembly protein CpaE
MASQPKIRVVIVDDDPEVQVLIKMRLKGHPRIEISGTGRNGREAVQLANTLRPDVMVLDVQMPVLDGLEAAARISSVFPSIGILILTSEASPDSIRAALRAGAKDYLDKSSELNLLADAIVSADSKRDRKTEAKGLGSVWAFYGSKGSVGSTLLAVDATFELAMLGYKAVLLDLDTLHGDCAFYLNLQRMNRGKTLLSSLDDVSNLDSATLQQYVRHYPEAAVEQGQTVGFDVIESPCDFVPMNDQSEEALITVVELLMTTYDYVVIDLPPGRIFDRHNLSILEFVERLFFVSARDMASIKSLLVFSKVLTRTSLSMNKFSIMFSQLRDQQGFDYDASMKGANLPFKTHLEVPLDPSLCSRALSKGLPVSAEDPEAPLARFVRSLVEGSVNVPPSGAPPSSAAKQRNILWDGIKRILAR